MKGERENGENTIKSVWMGLDLDIAVLDMRRNMHSRASCI